MSTALASLAGALFGLGLIGLVLAWRTGPEQVADEAVARSAVWSGMWARYRKWLPVAALALVVGFGAGLATGWPIAVPLTALAVVGLPKLFGQTSGESSIRKIEAIAVWTEMLQATLAASAGLNQAIVATATLSPPVIREATVRLSGRLTAGAHPRDALLQFADDLGDPSADRVVCALLLASSAHALRLGDLLTSLAESTRAEVALRLRIETSRASVRSGVRTVLVFSVVFAVGLTILARTYLAPFASPDGQLVLLIVGILYAVGLTTMVTLARPPAPVRLLGRQVAVR
jgi:Flp pilus assembly protein TadB